jgi:large subunit ribosomal protein L32
MAVPKGKVSKARRNSRNSANFKASAPALVECPKCHSLKQPHKVCPECGTYKNETVVKKDDKKAK